MCLAVESVLQVVALVVEVVWWLAVVWVVGCVEVELWVLVVVGFGCVVCDQGLGLSKVYLVLAVLV